MTVRSSKCSVSAKFFPMLVEKPFFGGVINPKTYLNHELGSKFFFLSDLAYKLVNLLGFEIFSCKMSKNWTFQTIIGLWLNFTYKFEVCYKGNMPSIFNIEEFYRHCNFGCLWWIFLLIRPICLTLQNSSWIFKVFLSTFNMIKRLCKWAMT